MSIIEHLDEDEGEGEDEDEDENEDEDDKLNELPQVSTFTPNVGKNEEKDDIRAPLLDE